MLQGITITYLDCRMCSLLYYWDNTIAQVMYVHCKHVRHMCTVQIPRVGIIFAHHGGVMPMVKVHYVRFDINIIGIFKCSLLMLKWMNLFVLLQVHLGNAGVSFVRHFIFSVKCLNKPNIGIDFP